MNKNQIPLVSVIIPTYKRPNMLGRAIESVLSQTYNNIEIIVVDDNGNNKYRKLTENFLHKYIKNNQIIYIKHKNNLGAPEARNTGICNSKGKFLSFLDDDDIYKDDRIEKLVNKFNETKNLGFVYSYVKYVDENNNILRYNKNSINQNALEFHLKRNIAPTSSLLVKKEVLNEVGYFKNLNSGQEYELILRILLKGYKVDYVDEFLVTNYIHNKERISTNKQKKEGIINLYQIKKEYLHLISEKKQKEVKYFHFLNLFRYYIKNKQKKEAFKCYIKAIKYNPYNVINIIELLNFIFGYSFVIKLKSKLHIIINKIKGD